MASSLCSFLKGAQKTLTLKEKYYIVIKIKNFCSPKDTLKEWKKTFPIHHIANVKRVTNQ